MKRIIVFIFFVALLVVGIAVLSPISKIFENTENPKREENSNNYIWIDYYKLRQGHYWINISESGNILYLKLGIPGTNEIEAVSSGIMHPDQVTQLFDLLEEIDFFNMGSKNPLTEEGIVYEGDVLKVVARLGNRRHQVSGKPPGFIPEGLNDIVKQIEEKIPSLKVQNGKKIFLRAVEMDSSRTERLKNRGRPFLSFTNQQLEDLPALKSVIYNPGRFVSLEPKDFENVKRYLSNKNYFFMSSLLKNFQVEVFFFHKGEKEDESENTRK